GSLLEDPSDLLGLSDVEGERLLDQAVDTRFSEGQRDIVMELSRYGDDCIVDPRVSQRTSVGEHLEILCHAVRVTARVGDSNQLHALQGTQVAGMVPAHHPQPDQPGTQCLLRHRHAPAFATVFTASTIRSRSVSEMLGWTGNDSTSRASISVTGRSTSVRNVCNRCTGVG